MTTEEPSVADSITPDPPTLSGILQEQIAAAQAEADACQAWAAQYTAREDAARARIAQLQALLSPDS